MGINIYARWLSQTAEEVMVQYGQWAHTQGGSFGRLYEAYDGGPHVTDVLFAEERGSEVAARRMSAELLRTRLPKALRVVAERERIVYGNDDRDAIARKQRNYTDFVELCERKERETGQANVIIVHH